MKSVYIIAEAGVNHNGDLKTAEKLIESAAEAGADAVKFQTFKADNLVTQYAQKAQYQKQTTDINESQFEMIQKLELDQASHIRLIQCCDKHGIQFLSSPFDLDSIDMLDQMEVPLFKIPSGEITNLPYLRKIAKIHKPVVLSTGMSNLGEIESALDVLLTYGLIREQITILHCNTEYPTPIMDVNLKAMHTIAQAFPGIGIGYSDHTVGITIPIAAVAMGARTIEKHFTLDKTMPGPDHKASLSLSELSEMVRAIRDVEKALGTGIKYPSPSEQKNKSIARKSIVASKAIYKGEVFSEDNLTTKRPGTGLNPMNWDSLIGKKAAKDFYAEEQI